MFHFILRMIFLVSVSHAAIAVVETYDFQNDEQRARYQQLTAELRCPKCQNQNLADSDSQIAADLRRELHEQLLAGKNDDAIVDFMRDRYGDFVLYKPRVQRNTWVLWFGPLALLSVVVGLLWWSRRAGSNTGSNAKNHIENNIESHAAAQPVVSAKRPLLSSRAVNLVSGFTLLAVAVGSLALYRQHGALQAMQITEISNAIFSGQIAQEQVPAQQDLLLSELDEFIAQHPKQEKFLYMRARMLAEAGSWQRAASDYRELVSRFPEQDHLLAEYAQVLFLQNNRVLTADVSAFLDQALQINPHNITALGLLGMHAFEHGDYQKTVSLWQRLMVSLPPGSSQIATIVAGINRAKELGNITDAPASLASADAMSVDVKLSVQVSIADTAQATADEVVFVTLKAVNGPRMPLAAVKTTVAALSDPIVLDTATSPMRGQIDLSSVASFEVVVRLSRSGQPIPAAGDWEGRGAPFDREHVPPSLTLSIDHPL
jgi:cytochrome c-type biogenesis protein CcmH